MKKAIVFLAEGFEEIEALTIVDVLRRGGVEVTTMSITDDPYVVGAHDVEILADAVDEYDWSDADLVVLPGGMPGALNLRNSAVVCDAVCSFAESGKFVAAICAAPFVLGELGVLKGRSFRHILFSFCIFSILISIGNIVLIRSKSISSDVDKSY